MKLSSKVVFAGLILPLAAALSHAAPVAENWDNSCAKCHGADGKGQTKVGKKLNVQDYTDAKVQASFNDEEMTKAIADGKGKMKGYKDEISEVEIKDLVGYIRKFKS